MTQTCAPGTSGLMLNAVSFQLGPPLPVARHSAAIDSISSKDAILSRGSLVDIGLLWAQMLMRQWVVAVLRELNLHRRYCREKMTLSDFPRLMTRMGTAWISVLDRVTVRGRVSPSEDRSSGFRRKKGIV